MFNEVKKLSNINCFVNKECSESGDTGVIVLCGQYGLFSGHALHSPLRVVFTRNSSIQLVVFT